MAAPLITLTESAAERVKRLVALAREDTLTVEDLRLPKRSSTTSDGPKHSDPDTRQFLTLDEMERRHIMEALRRTSNNKAQAARLLGVNKATIFRKLKAYGDRAQAS